MPQTISRDQVLAFYHAYSQRDLAAVETFLHEDVRWTVNGPVDVLAYCGERRNRGDVMRMLRQVVPQMFRHRQFDIDKILIDDNSVAVLARLSGVKHDGRAICFRLSHFVEFRDGRIVTLTSIIDSFNAVEQITGQTIDLGATPTLVPDNDLVSV
ncbi:MAG: nuclear transport factor 2 family protein [Pseudolabrys sp.]|nr:nuclear transport factor 2 family protein [Pseudolabrys sp.]MCW5683938.1 nuclear transport factor 2 family protein [Pseudolabrys sp.]